MNRKETWSFAVFVFWLISFPMNGILMPVDGGSRLPYFVLPAALAYFLGSRFMRIGNFDVLTRIASVSTALLTIAFLYFPDLRSGLLLAMGFASPPILFRAMALLKASPRPIVSAALGIAIGNAMVFALSLAPMGHSAKFFVIASALLLPAAFRAEILGKPEEREIGKLKRYLPVIFIFYLVGGLLYAVIMPRYDRVAFHAGIELLFYVASAVAGIALVKKERDHALAIGIVLGALSLSFLSPEGAVWTNLAMYAMQASFGLVDLYIVVLILDSGGTPESAGYAFGVECLAIALGEALIPGAGHSLLPVIAAGNVALIMVVLVFYFIGNRWREPGTALEGKADRGGGKGGGADVELCAGKLDSLLQCYYGEHQKRLSEKEKSVLFMILHGKTYKETGEALGISESTVKTYMKRIYEKMGVRSKEEIRDLLFDPQISG